MKTYFALIAFAVCLIANAQQTVTDTTFYERVIIEAGVRIPLGTLADKIGPSPEFGLWYRTRMANNDLIDAGFLLYMPTNRREFDYKDGSGVYKVKPAGVSGMVGVRINKLYMLGGVHYKKSVEWSTTGGYAFFMYNDKQFESGNGRTGTIARTYAKALSTFQVGQGVKYTINNMGFRLHYNYTPYGLFSDHVPRNFGSHSVSIGLFYKQ